MPIAVTTVAVTVVEDFLLSRAGRSFVKREAATLRHAEDGEWEMGEDGGWRMGDR